MMHSPQRPRACRYPDAYLWLVFAACLDIMLTWIILWRGGREVNILANLILQHFDIGGFVAFKLTFIVLFILICEALGRRSADAGRNLAWFAVAMNAFPVMVALAMLH